MLFHLRIFFYSSLSVALFLFSGYNVLRCEPMRGACVPACVCCLLFLFLNVAADGLTGSEHGVYQCFGAILRLIFKEKKWFFLSISNI